MPPRDGRRAAPPLGNPADAVRRHEEALEEREREDLTRLRRFKGKRR